MIYIDIPPRMYCEILENHQFSRSIGNPCFISVVKKHPKMGFIILRPSHVSTGDRPVPQRKPTSICDQRSWDPSPQFGDTSEDWGSPPPILGPSFFLPFTWSTQEVLGFKQFQTFFSRLSNLSHCWFMSIDVPLAWQHYLHGGVVSRPCSFHAPSSNLCRIELKNGKAPLSTTKVITWESGLISTCFQPSESLISCQPWMVEHVKNCLSYISIIPGCRIYHIAWNHQPGMLCLISIAAADDIPTSWCTEGRRRPKHQFRGHTPAIESGSKAEKNSGSVATHCF